MTPCSAALRPMRAFCSGVSLTYGSLNLPPVGLEFTLNYWGALLVNITNGAWSNLILSRTFSIRQDDSWFKIVVNRYISVSLCVALIDLAGVSSHDHAQMQTDRNIGRIKILMILVNLFILFSKVKNSRDN